MTAALSEADWEQFALEQLADLGWQPMHGPSIAPGSGERPSWDEIHLPGRIAAAIRRFNPELPRGTSSR